MRSAGLRRGDLNARRGGERRRAPEAVRRQRPGRALPGAGDHGHRSEMLHPSSGAAHDASVSLVLNVIDDHFGSQTRDIAAFLLSQNGATLQTLLTRFSSSQLEVKFRLNKESLCSRPRGLCL